MNIDNAELVISVGFDKEFMRETKNFVAGPLSLVATVAAIGEVGVKIAYGALGAPNVPCTPACRTANTCRNLVYDVPPFARRSIPCSAQKARECARGTILALVPFGKAILRGRLLSRMEF